MKLIFLVVPLMLTGCYNTAYFVDNSQPMGSVCRLGDVAAPTRYRAPIGSPCTIIFNGYALPGIVSR